MTIYAGQNLARLQVANVAALRLLSDVRINTTCRILGQVTNNDGGQGFFLWNPLSTAVDDGLDTIKPTDLTALQPGRWIRTRGTPLASLSETADATIDNMGVTPAGLASLSLGPDPSLSAYQRQESPVSYTLPATTWTDIEFNTVTNNDIPSAVWSDTRTLSLPSGNYLCGVSNVVQGTDKHQMRVWNNSDSVLLLTGSVGFAANTGAGVDESRVLGYFSIAGTKNIKFQHYAEVAGTIGFDPSPLPALYAPSQLIIVKI